MDKKLLLKFLLMESSRYKINTEKVILSIRVATGLIMLFAHGIGKWSNFSNIAPQFPDPFGFLGSNLSLALVVGAEVFGAVLLTIGLCTRWASFSLLFTMLTAAFIVNLPDPFSDKELAVIYALIFYYFTVAGGGKYSLDSLLKNKFL